MRHAHRIGRLCGVAVGVATAGCASIAGGGSNQAIQFSSAPSGATIVADGDTVGVTPATVDLARKDTRNIKILLDGYQPYSMRLNREINGWFWGNIALGGPLGVGVDAITGAMYKLTPDQITAELARAENVHIAGREEVPHAFVTLRPHPDWVHLGALKLSRTRRFDARSGAFRSVRESPIRASLISHASFERRSESVRSRYRSLPCAINPHCAGVHP